MIVTTLCSRAPAHRVRRALLVGFAVASTGVATGCSQVAISRAGGSAGAAQRSPATDSSSHSRTSGTSETTTTATPPKPKPMAATLTISPTNGATGVLPDAGVWVSAKGGKVTSAVLTDSSGRTLPVQVSPTSVRRQAGNLALDTTYTLKVAATGTHGAHRTTTTTFTTIKPAITATYHMTPSGGTYGVGMPAGIVFDSAVTTRAQRAAVQRAVSITTAPKQTGSWGWIGDRQLMWRPRTYWKSGTVVNVNAPIHGIQTGPSKYVGADASASFRIGASHVSTVDIGRHTMSVNFDGRHVATYKVSTGRRGRDTTTGTKVIMDKQPMVIMDSATVGIPKGKPGYYHEKVAWDMRVTWGGEFVHAAPWSVNSQGYANVSHGCTNMSPADAKWMYHRSMIGDVVQFVDGRPGTQMSPYDGIGVWLYNWSGWQSLSATA